jgi:hypothetical protein
MTIQDIVEREQVSERQAQRYVREGFQGHVLPSVKIGKAYHIEETDYAAWRIACGWEQPQPEAIPIPQVTVTPAPTANLAVHPAPCAEYPDPEPASMFRPATVDGPLTNCPHPASSNWPAPQTCEQYLQREAQKLVEKFQGAPNAIPEE